MMHPEATTVLPARTEFDLQQRLFRD